MLEQVFERMNFGAPSNLGRLLPHQLTTRERSSLSRLEVQRKLQRSQADSVVSEDFLLRAHGNRQNGLTNHRERS